MQGFLLFTENERVIQAVGKDATDTERCEGMQ
jgi:hypothetical protein